MDEDSNNIDHIPYTFCNDKQLKRTNDGNVNCPRSEVDASYVDKLVKAEQAAAKAAENAVAKLKPVTGGRKPRKMRRHSTNKRKIRRNKKSKTTLRKRSHK